jgi:hypothetical protein
LPNNFKVHIYGLSPDTLEVVLYVRNSRVANMLLRSFLSNIQRYLTTFLRLNERNIYVYLGVS